MNDVVPLLKFTPSAQDPEILEAITVQREPLISELVELALDDHGGVRHQLLVGPRGIGKTHTLSLVASRIRADKRADSVVIAWLEEDPWGIRTYDKFLAAILASLGTEIADAQLQRSASDLRSSSDGGDGLEGEELLRRAVGDRRLVLLVENLDEIFRRIAPQGQARFRAFAEDWRQLLILATTPQLFPGIRKHDSPFYGFFAVTHLDELDLTNATELLKRVARLRGDATLLEFLGTDTATRRLTAVEALAGGHPRVWLLLAGCISIAAIDELVPLFLEALDDLTPYYQDRLRELGDQQQELIVLLSEAGGALSNRALAERSGVGQNQVATMLRQLTDRGYVRRAQLTDRLDVGDRRMSFWELREPLMRLCLDVKQSRGKPLRIIVEFLRAWYGAGLLEELERLPPSAQLAISYASEAIRTLEPSLLVAHLLSGSPQPMIARVERGLSLLPQNLSLSLQAAKANHLLRHGQYADARERLEQLVAAYPPGRGRAWQRLQLATAQQALNEHVDEEELVAEASAVHRADPDSPLSVTLLALAYGVVDRFEDALKVWDLAIKGDPGNDLFHHQRGRTLQSIGRHDEALEAFTRATELGYNDATLHNSRASLLRQMEQFDEAEQATRHAIELNEENALYRFTLAEIALDRRDVQRAIPLLREALAISASDRTLPPGETEVLCEILWNRFSKSPQRHAIIAEIALAYREAGASDELGRGLIKSVPMFIDHQVSQPDADTWVDDWSRASSTAELEIPLTLLQAARAWKQDRDRAHLLELPPELREILVGLLTRDSTANRVLLD